MVQAQLVAVTLSFACFACGAGRPADPEPVAFSGERCFEGEWREAESGQVQRFAFHLHVSVDGRRADGWFHWRALEVSGLPRLVGREAREVFEGVHRAGLLELEGVRVEDPMAGERETSFPRLGGAVAHGIVREPPLVAVDAYRLSVSAAAVVGRSRTHGDDWSGALRGQRVECAHAPWSWAIRRSVER